MAASTVVFVLMIELKQWSWRIASTSLTKGLLLEQVASTYDIAENSQRVFDEGVFSDQMIFSTFDLK
jgi:hypothetical protein